MLKREQQGYKIHHVILFNKANPTLLIIEKSFSAHNTYLEFPLSSRGKEFRIVHAGDTSFSFNETNHNFQNKYCKSNKWIIADDAIKPIITSNLFTGFLICISVLQSFFASTMIRI